MSSVMTTFDSTKESLLDLLRNIKEGRTQLPDFQRGWVWDDEQIKSLLASIAKSFPIGAVMMLQTGNPEVKFQPRLVEGHSLQNVPDPDRLILDGQQRLTSLFQSVFLSEPVKTRDIRGKEIERHYYMDIAAVLDENADIEDAIISVPSDKVIRNFRGEPIADYSTPERECSAEMFPVNLVFDSPALHAWQMKYLIGPQEAFANKLERWSKFYDDIVQRFLQYQVPLIMLRKENPKEAVCQVFEKVNTGGVSLTAFELLTATFAADDYSLREDWRVRKQRIRGNKVLESLENTDFLQVVTLLATYNRKLADSSVAVSCKRKDVLRMTLHDYTTWAEPATKGFEKVAKFLYGQGIFSGRDLPYRTQLVPLAAVFAVLGDVADNDGVRTKLAKWFWCGVLGELYGGAIETRFAKDLPELVGWIRGGKEPLTVQDATFSAGRLLTLRTRNSAAYKGIYAILLREGCLDFRTGDTVDSQMYFDERIDIHHIFPKAYCLTQGIEGQRFDSIINKTPISAKTNRMIGGNAPSVYLERLEKYADITSGRMEEILKSHVIDSASVRVNDFDSFFEARQNALLDRIEYAMGKKVSREVTL